jgi:hypothetical protein
VGGSCVSNGVGRPGRLANRTSRAVKGRGEKERSPVSEQRGDQLSAATGIIFVGMWIAAAAVGFWFPGWSAEFDGSAQDWAAFYSDERTSILVSVLLASVGLIFLVWFFGHLHSVLRAAEGGSGRVSGIGFGAAIFGIGAIHVALILFGVAAFRPEETPPEITRTLNDIAFICGVPAAAAGSSLFAALALAILRTGALPAWLGWLAALSAVLQLGPLGGLFTFTGAFNLMDGLFGIMLVFISLGIWVFSASIAMVRRAGAGTAKLPPPLT